MDKQGDPIVCSDSTPSNELWVGLDVSKEHVDFFILNGKDNPSGRRPRRAAALAKLAAKLVAGA